MSIKTVDVQEAQRHLSELLSLAQQGNEVIIADGDTPQKNQQRSGVLFPDRCWFRW